MDIIGSLKDYLKKCNYSTGRLLNFFIKAPKSIAPSALEMFSDVLFHLVIDVGSPKTLFHQSHSRSLIFPFSLHPRLITGFLHRMLTYCLTIVFGAFILSTVKY